MGEAVIALNAGSSSVKFAVYATPDRAALHLRAAGALEGIGTPEPRFSVSDPGGKVVAKRTWTREPPAYEALLDVLAAWLSEHLGDAQLIAAGHRVVHGGSEFTAPVLLDPGVLERLEALTPLAPLHQPHSLALIRALTKLKPGLPQIACFDTAFHATNDATSRRFGVPRAWEDAGVRRYGFHGLSYEYIVRALGTLDPAAAAGRTVVAHLGNGASLCALVAGKSVATTMSFSPLDGLVMGTRCGALDPAAVLYLLRERKIEPDELERILYHESGLLGVSGSSSDMRELAARDDAGAREAIDLFVYRIVRELGSMAAAAGGLDTLVFTAGIGEHSAAVRAAVCRDSAWLGISLDKEANARTEGGAEGTASRISAQKSPVGVWMIPTDEDATIARHVLEILERRASHPS